MDTPAPHLTYDYASTLISKGIEEYKQFNKNLPPTRVVVHKTTTYWDSAVNPDYAEVEGLKEGIRKVLFLKTIPDFVPVNSQVFSNERIL
jgi:hypothetical protein